MSASDNKDVRVTLSELRSLWRKGGLSEKQINRLTAIGIGKSPFEVICYETGQRFDNAKDAGASVGVCASSIHLAIRNRSATGGFHWYRTSEGVPSPEAFRPSRIRAVCCMETGEIFPSATEAARALGTVVDNIRNSIYYGKAAKGKHFFYVGEAPKVIKRPKRTAVRCVETGQVYPSQAEACRENNLSAGALYNALKKGTTSHGFHWQYVEDDKENAPLREGRSIKVVCYETGEVFSSISSAAKVVGVNPSSIQQALSKKGFSGGYRWYRFGEERPEESEFLGTRPHNVSRRVVCYETGEVFESAKALATKLDVDISSVQDGIKRNGSVSGNHYFYHETPRPKVTDLKRRSNISVRCKETGEIFDSLSKAMQSVGVKGHGREALKKAIDQNKPYHGYHWEYVTNNDENTCCSE